MHHVALLHVGKKHRSDRHNFSLKVIQISNFTKWDKKYFLLPIKKAGQKTTSLSEKLNKQFGFNEEVGEQTNAILSQIGRERSY